MPDLKAFHEIKKELDASNTTLVAISKTKPIEDIQALYDEGQRHFGENKAQEMADKATKLPDNIKWHFVGHLQRNKVKYIAPHVHLIASVDSLRLLKEIDKQAQKVDRTIPFLFQIHIAEESEKFGFDRLTLEECLKDEEYKNLKNVEAVGVMGMATLTDAQVKLEKEFRTLKQHFDELKAKYFQDNEAFKECSMGMSGDYRIAIQEGSTMVRIGSKIFGPRN